MIRGIPPITSTGSNRGTGIKSSWGLGRTADGRQIIRSQSYSSSDYKIKTFKKSPGIKNPYIKVDETGGADLDIFEEGDELKVIGELPGFITKGNLDIQIEKGILYITSRPGDKKDYKVVTKLPTEFNLIKQVEVRNNIMTIILKKEVSGLEKAFQQCLEKFPELKDEHLKLKVERTSEKLEGAMGYIGEQRIIMLWVPDKLWGQWDSIKPIIYHELSHCINLRNPDKVFFERADEKSIKLWKMLQEAGVAKCEVVDGRKEN